ncbi:hypothetical protein KJ596_00695 [Patescibacteria group bacterium]|nr:hypothetical protein [Patescibacteria group bacterium]
MSKIVLSCLALILFFIVASRTVVAASCCFSATDGTCGQNFKRDDCETAGCEWNPLCDPQSALEQLIVLAVIFVRWVPFVAIIMGTIYLIIGAFNYITSGENAKNAEKARATIIYAILGIIISTFLYLLAGVLVDIIPRLGDYLHRR